VEKVYKHSVHVNKAAVDKRVRKIVIGHRKVINAKHFIDLELIVLNFFITPFSG